MGRYSRIANRLLLRGKGAVALSALTGVALVGCAPVVSPPGGPAPTTTTQPAGGGGGQLLDLGRNLTSYIKQSGDQIIQVPNGTYTAGTVSAPHAATSGAQHGWLVLKAQSPLGVVVDLAHAPLMLTSSTSRVLFVGFKFVNGSVYAYGSDLAFWYTDHSFPADVWSRQAPNPRYPEQGLYRAPRTVYTNATTSKRVSFFGVDAHDTATSFMISGSTDMTLQGTNIWNLSDLGLDPQDVVHVDAIGGVSGNTSGLTVRNSWIRGRIMIEDAAGHGGSVGGPFTNLLFADTWVSNSPSSGFTFTAAKQTSPRGVFGALSNVHSWGNNNGYARIDIVDGKQYHQSNVISSRVNVAESGVVAAAPPYGSISPSTQWRNAHPYDAWAYAIH
ncbi:MAG: hypothetical protein JWL83_577 [Actinomycetia bacterium]|nr:hypothetical protein [Actinomycetes bacterium]